MTTQTLPRELAGFLAKANVRVNEISASGQPIDVGEFDMMLDQQRIKDIRTRIVLKSQAYRAGLLDTGIIRRPYQH